MTKKWVPTVVAVVGLATSAVAGCAYDSGEEDYASSDGPSETTTVSAPAAADQAVLGVASSPVGDIVVDDAGMTVYVYDKDEVDSGLSACQGSCLDSWEPVTTDAEVPSVRDIDAVIGTIPAEDGAFQVTVNARPVYRFSPDAAPGDVQGQDLDSVWWVLDRVGNPILQAPA